MDLYFNNEFSKCQKTRKITLVVSTQCQRITFFVISKLRSAIPPLFLAKQRENISVVKPKMQKSHFSCL
jgi:hypothetical protein